VILTGKAFCLGDHINTDEIIPGRYLSLIHPDDLAKHAFADTIPTFKRQIQKTSIIVAGHNFGCGSSREQAAICLKYAKVTAIIAHSFGRIFFRNAINIGLPVIEAPASSVAINNNDQLKIKMDTGIIKNITTKKHWMIPPIPTWMIAMIEAGGYIPWILKKSKGKN
jgi:3-isopropylmalate/(R)-2-methylmalate dehydratase small subunit